MARINCERCGSVCCTCSGCHPVEGRWCPACYNIIQQEKAHQEQLKKLHEEAKKLINVHHSTNN